MAFNAETHLGEIWLFRAMGKVVPVRVISLLPYAVECEFLEDAPPVEAGEKLICDPGRLFRENNENGCIGE